MIFYEPTARKWLVCDEQGVDRKATPEEINAHIEHVIDYLRDNSEVIVTEKLPKTAQVAYRLLSKLGALTEQQLISYIYLCDWRHCLTNNRQITEIKWARNLGSRPVIGNATPDLWASLLAFYWDNNRRCIILAENDVELDLERSELDAIAHCFGACDGMSHVELTQLVCSTHPMLTSNNFEDLDLIELSKDYKALGHWQPGILYA